MAESSGTTTTGRGFSKIIQKSVTRTKEKSNRLVGGGGVWNKYSACLQAKLRNYSAPVCVRQLKEMMSWQLRQAIRNVLQNLGKADKTRDDDFEQHVQNFIDQQAAAERLQKELKHYAACVKEMSMASYSMYRTIKDSYEINWTGYTEVTSSVEMGTLWEDYMTKLNDQITNPLTTYINNFQDMKKGRSDVWKNIRHIWPNSLECAACAAIELHKQIAKRGRKLTDYDSARHNHESFCTAKRHDESKITKALDELNEARQVYESINTRLHDELPSFYEGRIGFLASLFNAMFTAEAVFEHETARLKDIMSEVTHRLGEESNRDGIEFRRFGVPLARSDSDIENQRLENFRHGSVKGDQRQNAIITRSESASAKPLSNPKGLPSSSSDLQRKPSASSSVVEMERSPVHGNSIWFREQEPTTRNQKADGEKSKEMGGISPKEIVDSNGHYSLPKPIDDIYKCPTSNQPINSLYPNCTVLYKVVATHAYVGDDTDELSFEPGDIISVVPFEDPEEQDEGWLTGMKETTKERGVFPENFTKRLE